AGLRVKNPPLPSVAGSGIHVKLNPGKTTVLREVEPWGGGRIRGDLQCIPDSASSKEIQCGRCDHRPRGLVSTTTALRDGGPTPTATAAPFPKASRHDWSRPSPGDVA